MLRVEEAGDGQSSASSFDNCGRHSARSPAAKVGVEWFIVEQDICPGLPMDSVRISFKNLKAMGLA